ncbi:hypothetical protein ABZ477_19100, partial [Microbacterium sp. NPDC019599]|uniref:hypothetical protein n=1 Tax=Microbacterium sp. NPDC019599 TaxID=3154690 RepID=UPI0033E2492B
EGSVEHVEVFRMLSVGTSILEGLDAYPPSGAHPHYTLNCEEPWNVLPIGPLELIEGLGGSSHLTCAT